MHSPLRRPTHAGFTLMELMIAVAIVAILSTIALPTYRSYVLRANRTVAKSALAEVVSRQASHQAETKRYASKFSRLGWGPDDTLYLDREGNLHAASGADSIYALTLQGDAASATCPPGGAPTATAFTVVATPIKAQLGDTRCGAMCLSSVGIKAAGGTDAADCWKR